MGPRKAEILPPGPAVHARHDHAPLNWMASAKDNNGSWPSRIFGFRWTTGRAGNTLTSTPCPAGMLVSGRSETTRGFNQRWRSVATRSQTLGPGRPRESWWMAYTALVGARERPLNHTNQRNGEHLWRRTRNTRYPLKGGFMLS